MKTEKLIDSLIKNIDGFNVKKLFELIIKIIINFFKFTDYLSKKLLKIKEKYNLKKLEKIILLVGALYLLIEIYILRNKNIFSSFFLFLFSIYFIVDFIDSVDSIRRLLFPVYMLSTIFPTLILSIFEIRDLSSIKVNVIFILLWTLSWVFLSLIVKEEVSKLLNKFLVAFTGFLLLFIYFIINSHANFSKFENIVASMERTFLGIWGLTEFLLELREYCQKNIIFQNN
ncbi:hypothetical protein PSC67_01845 [Fusobacterium nucleatum]|nr:hypothetical protein [Fusobacterium nucleatum]WDF25247.1 hypothetical protein PSC67_01845 [Fusobacterium nucleatum]